MAGSLPLPIKVAAKVITSTSVDVPALTDKPFVKSAKLEKGIHVHWALPDVLTRGKLVPQHDTNFSVLPGVPDLWLVVRFNPSLAVLPGSPLPPKRLWRAWVVDSVAQTSTDLSTWTPPGTRDKTKVHTLAGLLPDASSLNYPGYGILGKGATFDTAMAAYYPASRLRFGFWDKLEDLAGAKGTVTYAVVGWFSERGWDALYSSPSREKMLNEWKVAHQVRPNSLSEAAVLSATVSETPAAPSWTPRTMKSATQATPSVAKLQDVQKAIQRGGAKTVRAGAVTTMKASFPDASIGQGAPVVSAVDFLQFQLGPDTLMCHGAVVEVNLAGSQDVGANPKDEDVRLYPSIKRAMARMANAAGSDDQQTDFIEMLLQDVDAQKSSLSGVVDMPGAVHALSFQNVPGRSKWFARMDVYPPEQPLNVAYFNISPAPFVLSQTSSAYWPMMQGRSASSIQPSRVSSIPPLLRRDPADTPPSQQDLDNFGPELAKAFGDAATAALSQGKVLDSHLVYVCDHRPKAKSLELGRTADGSGTKGAGWWLDISDPFAVPEFRKSVNGAVIHLPDGNNLYELPGTSWHRPWSPQLVLHGVSRSYRAGQDGRFTADGYLVTRAAGESLMSLSVGSSSRVYAKDLMESANNLFSLPGIPSDARLLIQEKMLFDPSNAGAMSVLASSPTGGSNRQALEDQFRAGIRGMWLSRDPKLVASAADKLDAIGLFGEMLDNNATSFWVDPRDPLFIDATYSYVASAMATGWKLDPDEVEFTRVPGTPVSPKITEYSERTKVSASIPNILQSTFTGRESLNIKGELVKAMNPPDGIEQDTFLKLDVVTAPLAALDANLTAAAVRERSGALCMKKVELVDIFGIGRTWQAGVSPEKAVGDANLSYWTDLTPRLPYWARLQFDLKSAEDPARTANILEPPICGILVPDFIEHALEVFDGSGQAIGQLTTDHQGVDKNPGQTLQVFWEVHPWVAAKLQVARDDVNAIAHPKLRTLISTIVQQSALYGNDPAVYYETGLSALLRIIDTIRGTLDPSIVTPDRRVRLIGEPILVMAATLELQSTGETNPTTLAQTDPAPLPPVLPTVRVRIGDITRPDDGVLGCFIEADAKFAPVSMKAKENALLNVLALNLPMFHNPQGGVPVLHSFIADHPSEFQLTQNAQQDILLLTDIRGGLYATTGALPRRKITMEREYIAAAVRNLEPTFSIGPIMTTSRLGIMKPFVPPPQVDGYESEYIYETDTPQPTFPDLDVPPMPPLGELPNGRAILSDGWIRIRQSKKTP